MRARFLHPVWLILFAVLLAVGGMAFYFTREHDRGRQLIADVKKIGGQVHATLRARNGC